MSEQYVVALHEVDETQIALVGGKGAHLGALGRIDGVRVPPGFCVTTDAFRRITASAPSLDEPLRQLSRVDADDREAIHTLSTAIRRILDSVAVPDDVAAEIAGAMTQLGRAVGCAVRSSATAEDLPTASFAGQHDTFLNVVGPRAILDHVRRCWASLFSERAVTYRQRNGIDHRKVHMAVVVQQMVPAQASGVLFTADPVTSNRRVASVAAGCGLGDALVGGLVNADAFEVRDRQIVARTIAVKERAVHAAPGGGTHVVGIEPARQAEPALTDAQVVRLVDLGRRIEAHVGRPQDIEWCLVDDDFQFVQSRPITTLFPIPAVDDGAPHVYLSVGHAQMMTDAMTPLGLSVWQLTAGRPMFVAGGRLFVDVAGELASPASRAGLLDVMGRSDPLTRDALQTILDRGDVVPSVADDGSTVPPAPAAPVPIEADPALVVELIEDRDASIAALRCELDTRSGPPLLEFIRTDLHELRRMLVEPRSRQVLWAGMEAVWWLNDHLEAWLGERDAADTLTQSVPHNVTSEMGLALLDVADAIRPHPEVVAFLRHVEDDAFLDELPTLPGGRDARDAIVAWLDTYGMRCIGEIDITRPRWSEHPAALVSVILGNVDHFEPGASSRRFEQGRQAAATKEHDVLRRLRALPDGDGKAEETKRMIDRVRAFIGYREHPKYHLISRYWLYKQALLDEAERLVQAGVLRDREDVYFLTFDELDDVVRTQRVDDQLIRRRRDEFTSHRMLTPPRVLTSDGEVITGSYRRDDVPAGALIGLAVSAGTVEGRARVIVDMAQADVAPGDILVTTHTDPSWTPLFVSVAGLVTEVGGLMTHGAVIAREYGLPAVVGVEAATRRIRDGQRIRVRGSDGYVELLTE